MENAEKEARHEAMYAVRDKFWKGVGEVDPYVLSFMINPAFMGQPAWPDLRQAFKRIVTKDSVILATDGLSDEFSDSEGPDYGFEIELYIELPAATYRDIPVESLQSTWAFQLLNQAAMNAAHTGAYRQTADQYGVFSTEFYEVDAPEGYLSGEARVGALIGMKSAHVPAVLGDTGVRMLSVTLLQLKELEYLVQNGGKGRRDLVEMMERAGVGNVSSLDRPGVV